MKARHARALAASVLAVAASGVIVAGTAGTAAASATTLYAAPAATGAATCASAVDACTIGTAVADATTSGDVIDLAAGDYVNGSTLSITLAGTLTIDNTSGATATLDGNHAYEVLSVAAGAQLVLRGVTVANGSVIGAAGSAGASMVDGGAGGTVSGGGIANAGTLTVVDSAVTGNTATGGAGGTGGDDTGGLPGNGGTGGGASGAGIENTGTLTVADSTIAGNTAQGGAGGTGGACVTGINNGNGGTGGNATGAGIDNKGTGTVQIEAATISGNVATGGSAGNAGNPGGCFLATATPGVAGTADGGGLQNAAGGTAAAEASLFAGSSTTGGDCGTGTVTDGGYNLDDDGTCTWSAATSHGGSATDGTSTYGAVLDDYLGTLGANGGPTQTVALRSTPSPATALADPALGAVPTTVALLAAEPGQAGTTICAVADQRGTLPTAGVSCDVGAFYLAPPVPTVTSVGTSGSCPATTPSGPAAGGATVTVCGTGFDPTAANDTVDFGSGNPGTVTTASATELTVTAPAHAAGTVDVTVTVAGLPSATSAADQFTYQSPPAPVVTPLPAAIVALSTSTPSLAPGSSVTFTATVTTSGVPDVGASVSFDVSSGPDAGQTMTGATDATGTATFTYANSGGAGTDTVTAAADGALASAQVAFAGQYAVTLSPASQGAVVGTAASLTATVTDPAGGAVPAATVMFTVSSGPDAGPPVAEVTNASGTAAFAVTAAKAGTDTVSASYAAPASASSPAAIVTSAPAVVTWQQGQPPTIPGLPPAPPISDSQGGASIPLNQGSLNALTNILGITPPHPVVAAIESPGGGVFVSDSSGNLFTGQGALYLGGISQLNPNLPPGGSNAVHLVAPIVGITLFNPLSGSIRAALAEGHATGPAVRGYDLVAADGGVFAFGDAPWHGSLGGVRLAAPVVSMALTPDGLGYWLVAADGGVFALGDAGYFGSAGGTPLAAPVTGIAPTPDGLGYWLVAADGGVFAFGDARYLGSASGRAASPVSSIVPTADGGGYWLVEEDGTLVAFGDAPHLAAVRSPGPGTVLPGARSSSTPPTRRCCGRPPRCRCRTRPTGRREVDRGIGPMRDRHVQWRCHCRR